MSMPSPENSVGILKYFFLGVDFISSEKCRLRYNLI